MTVTFDETQAGRGHTAHTLAGRTAIVEAIDERGGLALGVALHADIEGDFLVRHRAPPALVYPRPGSQIP